MAADRENYTGEVTFTWDEPSEYSEDGYVPERRQRSGAGRHAAPARGRKKDALPADGRMQDVPSVPARSGSRRPISKKRRHRRLALVLALVFAAGAVFVLTNLLVGRVKGFQITSATADRQVLSWERSGIADSYDIYDGSGARLARVEADQDTQYAVEGLDGGTRYTYSIVAVNDFFGERYSGPADCSGYTLPANVETLTAMNSGTGAILSWKAAGDGGYEVQYTDGYSLPVTVEADKRDAEGFSVPDLNEGAQYTFQIRGFIQDGEERLYSDWSFAEPLTAVHTADMTGIDVTKPMVALTFDDGPDYVGVTDRILATLKEYDAHATFFQVGRSVADQSELMGRIAAAGHEIACHTYDHSHYGSSVTADDIVRADDAIEQAVGHRPSAFRSPGGETTDLIRQVCAQEGMPIFYWSIDTEDWRSRDADAVCDMVMDYVSDGDIILMHNVYESTADAVERIVPYLAEKGYQMVTVSQLVQAKTGAPPVPGTQYVTATVTS